MKKSFLLLFIFCLQLVPAKAQWVTIPDTNFVIRLTLIYPSCMNGNLMDTTCTQIINETDLDIANLNITNIDGTQFFDNLLTLDCSWNALSNLPVLPHSLTTLNCRDNQLSSLPALPSTLTNLMCRGNQINSLPTLPNSLAYLNCSYNQLSSLPALPNSLLSLDCKINLVSNLPALPNSLSYLNCGFNELSSMPPLPNSLVIFQCDFNLLDSLPAFPNSLYTLVCSYNQLSSLPALPNSLANLNCEYNQLTSLPALPNNIMRLNCYDNQLNSLPTIPSILNEFNIQNNNIPCLLNLPQVIDFGNISNNLLTCVPNQTSYSLGLPLCMDNDPVNNPNYCSGVANMGGYVYTDLNTNCSYSITDWHIDNIPVKVYDTQNNMLAMSYTVNGGYSFTLMQPGTFVVTIDDSILPFSMDCGQANNQSVTLTSANQTIQNINFPVVCDTAYDIKVNSFYRQGWVFPGQQHTLQTNITNNIHWYNFNCSSPIYSGTVSINATGPVTYVAPANNALTPTVNGNTFTYNITDFNTLTPQSFGLKFLTDTTAQANDTICVHVEINPTPIDADTTNNVYDFCYNVVNSYDPNMKEVYPVNVLPGYDDWFTYTIHFQNTGNAPAFNIRLRDTLDTNLDINTFEIRGYSHPANVSINGNNLTVRFNNIMLPDSTTDYEGSMGYFQYRIKPLPNMPLGTQIENTAYIYFDYNAPIITNTTQNNFLLVTDVKNIDANQNNFVIYPNPSSGIYFFNDSRNVQNVEVFNMMGELIISQGNTKQINLQAYPKGIYVVRINGSTTCRLVKD